MSSRLIAVVGIDGSGKSSGIAALRASEPCATKLATINCPDFHENPDGPMHTLSRQLKAVGIAADRLQVPAVKAATLYLRMTLYGIVEDYFRSRSVAEVIVTERHPFIETLVYAPLYRALSAGSRPDSNVLDAVFELADTLVAGASVAVQNWQEAEENRLGVGGDLWTIIEKVSTIVQLPVMEALAWFEQAYQTQLPDEIYWVDLPPVEAVKRCEQRGAREIHENLEHLTTLRAGYARTMQVLRELPLEVKLSRVVDFPSEMGLLKF